MLPVSGGSESPYANAGTTTIAAQISHGRRELGFPTSAICRPLTRRSRAQRGGRCTLRRRGDESRGARRWLTPYGAVVDSVKVSVSPYVPVRSGSVAPIVCLNETMTASLATGPPQVRSVSGLAAAGTAANAVFGVAAFVAFTWSACAIT